MSQANLTAAMARAFAVAGLQHKNFAILNGEFEILHILEMRLEDVSDRSNSTSALGKCFFKSATGSGVRTPPTTSSPWALIRNSP